MTMEADESFLPGFLDVDDNLICLPLILDDPKAFQKSISPRCGINLDDALRTLDVTTPLTTRLLMQVYLESLEPMIGVIIMEDQCSLLH